MFPRRFFGKYFPYENSTKLFSNYFLMFDSIKCLKIKFSSSSSSSAKSFANSSNSNLVNKFSNRSHNCSEINDKLINENVQLYGWLVYQRMGKFLILRDSYGSVQLFVKDSKLQKYVQSSFHLESVIKVNGTVCLRPEKDINTKLPNGNVEVVVDHLELINNSMPTMPFLPREFDKVDENVRLKYRYIDLRRSEMIRNLRVRSSFIMNLRNRLANEFGFVEVETPTLFKATPGGAQEFVVPTRFKDQYYSLVQSPQQFKQLLMIGGIDRYFQIARCYRDEGTKSDRQPEFTQLDIEISFTSMEKVMELIEELLENCWPIDEEKSKLKHPFLQMKYEDAMKFYGTDKPDLRSDIKIDEISTELNDRIFMKLVIPEDYDQNFIIRNFINNELSVQVNTLGFTGKLNHFKYSSLPLQTNEIPKEIIEHLKDHFMPLKPNDYLWIASGRKSECLRILGRIRARCIDLIERDRISQGFERKLSLLWIRDFPLFTWDEKTDSYQSSHHPFTAPSASTKEFLYSDPLKVIGQSFDLVINGQEIGGGSIRIESSELQEYILVQILKCYPQSMNYFFEALKCGCPPHGGFAIGLDRLMALIFQYQTLRDVIAFPKSADGKDLMSNAPCSIDLFTKNLYNLK